MPSGTSPQTHVRDGVGLTCAGIAGWGLAPLLGEPGLAIPALIAGAISGGAVLTTGLRRARRSALIARMSAAVSPMLGNNGAIRAGRWTHGWPGVPRQVKVRYGTGRIKMADAPTGSVVDIGEKRWATEVARAVGDRLEADYKVRSNDPQMGRLTLQLHVPPAEKETDAESAQAQRAKRIVTELLGASAQVTKTSAGEAGEVIRMEVTHEAGSKLVAPGYRRRVERTVNGMLPGRWRAHWDMEADTVVFEVRPSLPDSLWIPPLEKPDDDPLKNYRAVEVPYGVDEDGEVIAWRPAVIPQWLITGTTGSGKTSTGHGIITQISQYGWPVWIADGKGIEFLGFRDWPNVQIVASTIPQQVAVIHRAWELMEYRYQLVVDGLARTEDFEPLVLFIDEFTDLKANLMAWYGEVRQTGKGGDPTKPRLLDEIGSIARKGRTARIHMVLAMQRPDAAILDGENRENFGMRTSMGPLSPHGAEMMWNNQVTGVALPRGKVGRAIGTNKNGFPVELQAYRVPDPKDSVLGTEEYELLQKLRPRESRHPRMVIIPPEIDWTADEPIDPTYTDFASAEWATAEDRPDLDPLANQEISEIDGRALSSTMALFGLNGRPTPARRPVPNQVPAAEDTDDGTSPAELEEFAGYSQMATCRASQLRVGDLICVDPDFDAWAVVEEEPIADFDDEESLVISWRDDQDESGQLILESGAMVQVRRPQEDD